MGYRHYFYLVDIEECDKVEHMSYNELAQYCLSKEPCKSEHDAAEYDVWFPETLGQEEVFGFGKLYYDDTAERIYSHGRPVFALKETQNEFFDYNPYRMGKDGMLEAIEIYKQKIIDHYKGLFEDGAVQILPFGIEIKRDEIKSTDKLIDAARDQLLWWEKLGVVDLDESHEAISKSWLYEHQIFELVRLYKAIDWDKKCLLFYGY
jgi:uncharacterized protein YggL (DUF469 family)